MYYDKSLRTKSQQDIDNSNLELRTWVEQEGNRSLDDIKDDISNCTDHDEMTKLYQEMEAYRGIY